VRSFKQELEHICIYIIDRHQKEDAGLEIQIEIWTLERKDDRVFNKRDIRSKHFQNKQQEQEKEKEKDSHALATKRAKTNGKDTDHCVCTDGR